MPRNSSNKRGAPSNQPRSSKGAAGTGKTPSASRVNRPQTSRPPKRRVQRQPQQRVPPCEPIRIPQAAARHIVGQARSELGSIMPPAAARHLIGQARSELESFVPQTAALDLTTPVPSVPENMEFLVSAYVFVPGSSVLPVLSGPDANGVLDLSSGTARPSTSSIPPTAPTTIGTGEGSVGPAKATAAAAVPEPVSRPGSSGSAMEVFLLDDDSDVEIVADAAHNDASVEEMVRINNNPGVAKPSGPYVEDAILAEASLVPNRVLPRVPLLLDHRDHHEVNDRLRKTREAIPSDYPLVYQSLRPKYPERKRIPERKSPRSFR